MKCAIPNGRINSVQDTKLHAFINHYENWQRSVDLGEKTNLIDCGILLHSYYLYRGINRENNVMEFYYLGGLCHLKHLVSFYSVQLHK